MKLSSALGLMQTEARELYQLGNPIIDLRATQLDEQLNQLLGKLAAGNEGSSKVGKLTFDLNTYEINAEISVRHRHTWGSISEILKAVGKQIGKWADKAGDIITQSVDAAGNRLLKTVFNAGDWTEQVWNKSGVVTKYSEFTSAGKQITKRFLNSSGQWIAQTISSASGKILEQFEYFGKTADTQLMRWQNWNADGVLTVVEEFNSAGKQTARKLLNASGHWISQTLDAGSGKVLQQWEYFGKTANTQLMRWQRWKADKYHTFLDLEVFTINNAKIVDAALNSSGKWIEKQFDQTGKHLLEQLTCYGNVDSVVQKWEKWKSDGSRTLIQEFNKGGDMIKNQWLQASGDLKGQWIFQQLDKLGRHVLEQTIFYGGFSTQKYEWATWTVDKTTTNFERYSTKGVKTLDAYLAKTGEWVESRFSNGKEYSLRKWNSAGKYLGDKYKSYKDAGSQLDPTTQSWWPF